MKRDLVLKIAASTMVISTTLTSCGPLFGGGSVASSSDKPVKAKHGPKYANKAEKALKKGQTDKAIAYAERSVAAVGSDAETRALLGRAYMAAGRFSSAERSFKDAMELGKNDARTILSLSLSQLALGKASQAKRLVEDNRQFIPTADYGLALALAGETKAAVNVLEQAIRNADANGRTRQNLGLAYALDGRWREAKLMATQDMSPVKADQRVMQWAQMARPGAYQTRVASLLNITPMVNDPGQPVRLALNAAPASMVAKASPSQDYAKEVASFDRNTPLPAVGPAPRTGSDVDFTAKENNVKVAKVAVPASKPATVASAPAPIIKAPPAPARVAPSKKFIMEGPAVSTAKAAPAAKPVPVKPLPAKTPAVQAVSVVKPIMQKVAFNPVPRSASKGTHLVQLGAFSSPESAKRAWGILSSKNRDLAAFQYASSRVNVKGKTLYRLAAMGFGNAQSANDMCVGIKAKGGGCIVRHVKGVNPARIAKKPAPRKIASR